MFGLSFDKLLLIGAVAIFLLGPQRLPGYAAKLGQFVRNLRQMADGARDRMREEMGPDVFDDIDWQRLDPRQYDPRRIIRDALLDDGTDDGGSGGGVLSAPSAAGAPATTTVIGATGVAAAANAADAGAGIGSVALGAAGAGITARTKRLEAGAVPPFDTEAT